MKFFRLKLIACLFATLFLLQASADAQSSKVFDREKLDTFFNKLADENKMMGSVAIDSAGREVYRKTVGFMNTDRKKADDQTRYRIGSVTKTFTATMIMQLVEEGKLSLSTRLSEYYPRIPQADSITVKHMLKHQSGLFNFTNASDYSRWMTEQRSREQMLELFRGQEPQFSPGAQTSYSNTNYVLLGYIIEDITGKAYAQQLQQRIVKPLNLQHTYYGDGIDSGRNEAASFRFTQSDWSKAPETDMSIPGGAGGIVSTPDDLTDFISALFAGELVSQESLDKMTRTEQRLGMGLMKIPFYDTYAYGHNGGIDGFQSNLSYFPKEKVAMAFTGNGLNYNMNDILIGILSIYFGKDFQIPSFDQKSITLSTEQMRNYTGTYVSDQLPMDIKVFVEDSALKAQATGQQAFPLSASDETTLYFKPAGITMKFDSLKNGKYQSFRLEQSGGSYQYNRKN